VIAADKIVEYLAEKHPKNILRITQSALKSTLTCVLYSMQALKL